MRLNDRADDVDTPDLSHRWLVPDAASVGAFLDLPELALVSESCDSERALHAALREAPLRAVTTVELAAIADDDARSNYETFLRFRDAVVAAGTFEAYYLGVMRSGRIDVPPVFVDLVVEAIANHLFAPCESPFDRRAAQLLHRPQQVAFNAGRVLAADLEVVRRSQAESLDVIGGLLRGDSELSAEHLPVLGADNALRFAAEGDSTSFVLDLTHEVTRDVGHGIGFRLTRADSGMTALARVLELWTLHFLGVSVVVTPVARIDDPAWRWHIGLDAQSSAMLDDLYRGIDLEAARAKRLIGLFKLDFANAAEMRADVAGKPVWLGLATDEASMLKVKPQNLLLNLPLAASM